ncbi:cell division protein FtsL [Spirochaeta isovalerica]|uniref:Cell division protein FtsL n=1 Tax=Spirochaeta isovalerica TaxID=150 RepID=A0A841RFI3_9SPIO|nr:cell division protein FtsL [Spirochaeta isovalerica]
MKRLHFITAMAAVVLAVGMLFLNVWQSFRYNRIVDEVAALEMEQKRLLEQNKRLIAGTAVLSSPGRIDEIAKDELGLEKQDPTDIIRIELPEERP